MKRNHRLVFSFLALGLVVGTSAFSAIRELSVINARQESSAGVNEPATVQDPDEYAVWNVLLTQKYSVGTVKELVIRDRTARQNLDVARLPNFEGAASDAASNLKAKNQVQYNIANKLSTNLPHTFLSQEAENKLFHYPSDNRIDAEAFKKIQDGWSQFRQDHPGARGLITLSRVGFNSDKSVAVVYIGIQASMMKSNGTCFLLTKKNGSWEIEREDVIWYA